MTTTHAGIPWLVAFLAFAVHGCGTQDSAADAPAADSTSAQQHPDSLALARFAARVPAGTLVREGACPFECCIYRDWTARSVIPLYADERGAVLLPDTLRPGETFTALGGNVHITGIRLLIVVDTLIADGIPFRIAREREIDAPPYWFPGDTLVMLDHVGEGSYNVWHEGRIAQIGYRWVVRAEFEPGGRNGAYAIGTHATEWWIHVRRQTGTTGWYRYTPGLDVDGADACAGPQATAAPPMPGEWGVQVSGVGIALSFSSADRPVLRIACVRDPAEMTIIAETFRAVGSEERLSFGVDEEPFVFVADPMADRPSGVEAKSPIPADLLDRFEHAREVRAVYGAQTLGPLPPPAPGLITQFINACRRIAGSNVDHRLLALRNTSMLPGRSLMKRSRMRPSSSVETTAGTELAVRYQPSGRMTVLRARPNERSQMSSSPATR
jgi:hypothetical protein